MLPRDLIRRCARNFPDKPAYYCGERVATWRDMDRRAEALALALAELGVGKGDTVAIYAQESIAIYEHFFACMKLGAVRVGINCRYAEAEVRHVVHDSTVRVLIVEAGQAAIARAWLEEFAADGVILIGLGDGHGLALDYDTLLERCAGRTLAAPPLAADDTVLISYTSGTSGLPKGVVLSHDALQHVIVHTVIGMGFSADDVWYMPAAASWIVICLNVLGLANGMAHVIPEGGFETRRFLRDIERRRVSVFLHVPTAMRWIMQEYATGAYDFSSVRMVIFGSSPASPALISRIHATWPQCALLQTYGLTEATGGWVTFMTPGDYRRAFEERPDLLASIGRCGTHFEASIRDADGAELPAGERGELWLRGPTLMKEYLHLPEKTREVLTEDGWLRCSDIASMDAEGYIFLHDRKDFLIITGAVNVFPSSVEAVLSMHPQVEEVAVVGVPHPEWGEAVVAVVKAQDGAAPSPQALLDFCRNRLGKPELPKHILFVSEPLPKTLTAKLRKKEIRDWFLRDPSLVPWPLDAVE
jgi:acyl-CoA synthetase (AMP-forming)/AMP-acid ligase II